jgi:hypothetical protein
MLAIIAALIFFVDLVLYWTRTKTNHTFNAQTLLLLGLLCLSLHLANPVSARWPWRTRRRL